MMQSKPSDIVLSLIVAMTQNGVIGLGNKIPWRLPSDQKRFKQITMGHPVIMGRSTWESIPEKLRPLTGRTNIIVTRQSDYHADGAIVVTSIADAYSIGLKAPGSNEIFIGGGAEIYRLSLPQIHRAYVTIVYAPIEGDVFFPKMRPANWCCEISTIRRRCGNDEYPTSFQVLQRIEV